MIARETKKKEQTLEELCDKLMGSAGGISCFHLVVYLALITGTNCIRVWINALMPFLIQK